MSYAISMIYRTTFINIWDIDDILNQFQVSLKKFNFERERDLLNHALRNIHSP